MQIASGDNFQTGKTGVGAVIFDSGPDPLSVHLANLQSFERGQNARRQEDLQKARLTGDLFKGLKLDSDGILDTDTEYFQNRSKGVHDFATEALRAGYDPTKPGGGAFTAQLQSLGDSYKLEAEVSKGQKEMAKLALAEATAKPDQYDVEGTQKRVIQFATMPFKDRNKNATWADLVVKKPANLQGIISTQLKNLDLKPKNVADEKGKLFNIQTTPQGKDIMIQQTETLPLDMAANLLPNFNANPEFESAANYQWSKIANTPAEAYYTKLADQYQQQGLPVNTSLDAFKLQQIYNNNNKDKNLTNLGDNLYTKKALDDKDALEEADGLYQSVTKMFAKHPDLIEPGYYESNRNPVGEDGKPVMDKHKVFGTSIKGLEGRQLGEFLMAGDDGVPKKVPNIIEKSFETQNGVGVITVQSRQKYEAGELPSPIIGYKTPYSLVTALISGAPSEGRDVTKTNKLLGKINDVEQKYRMKYGNNWDAQAGLTPEQITKREEIRKTPWSIPVRGQQPLQQPAQQKVAVVGYKIGETQGGYRYTGGDPADQSNWEKE